MLQPYFGTRHCCLPDLIYGFGNHFILFLTIKELDPLRIDSSPFPAGCVFFAHYMTLWHSTTAVLTNSAVCWSRCPVCTPPVRLMSFLFVSDSSLAVAFSCLPPPLGFWPPLMWNTDEFSAGCRGMRGSWCNSYWPFYWIKSQARSHSGAMGNRVSRIQHLIRFVISAPQ